VVEERADDEGAFFRVRGSVAVVEGLRDQLGQGRRLALEE